MITCLGAVLGVVLGTRLPDSLKKALNNTLGIAAIAMGIVLILKVKNLSAVVLTLVIGSILGELVMLDDRIRKLVCAMTLQLGQIDLACIALALAGATVGFLRYNFNPAKIFMGDTGSMLLGYTLAAISVMGAVQT